MSARHHPLARKYPPDLICQHTFSLLVYLPVTYLSQQGCCAPQPVFGSNESTVLVSLGCLCNLFHISWSQREALTGTITAVRHFQS